MLISIYTRLITGIKYDRAITCKYKIDGRGRQHCVKPVSVCIRLMAVVGCITKQVSVITRVITIVCSMTKPGCTRLIAVKCSVTKQVPVCTRLIAVVCSKPMPIHSSSIAMCEAG